MSPLIPPCPSSHPIPKYPNIPLSPYASVPHILSPSCSSHATPFPFPPAFPPHPSPCPSLPIPSCVPHPDSPAGAGGSRQVEQHCPGPRSRWFWGQSSMGQGVKEHSTSPPWEHGNGSPAVPTGSPKQSRDPPSRCREAHQVQGMLIPGDPHRWRPPSLGDPHPWGHPGPTWQTHVVQSSPSRLNRAPCAYVRPRKLHFSGKRGSSGAGAPSMALP